MICRTCKGTGKVLPKAVTIAWRGRRLPSGLKDKRKMCPDCYGGGKVINKEVSGPKTGRFPGEKLNEGRR